MLAGVEENRVFYRAVVRPEMRKQVRYVVMNHTGSSGTIPNAHCECTAGTGKPAMCKHVATALYGIKSQVRSGQMLTEQTCAGRTQKWRVSRKDAITSSPKKAQHMKYRVHKVEDTDAHTAIQSDEQQACKQQRAIPGEEDRLLNLIKNYQVCMRCHRPMHAVDKHFHKEVPVG